MYGDGLGNARSDQRFGLCRFDSVIARIDKSANTNGMRLTGLLVLVGCAHNVPQDRATGADGRVKGAAPIVFDNGEARVKGVVTYPGGDRVDWKVIELPEKTRGKLDLQLTWKTPRPGLQVGMDVFDQYNLPVVATNAAHRRGGRSRTATINDAVGKYFVRIYAPKRGDAGAYTLTANFIGDDTPGGDELIRKTPIPDPPKLAAVPEVEGTCDVFDPADKDCKKVCHADAPVGWKACDGRDAKAVRDAEIEAIKTARAECLKNQPKQVKVRIIHVEVSGDIVNVKLDKGTDHVTLLDTGWTARVLVNGTEKPIDNGAITLKSVGKTITRGSSGLTVDQLNSNPQVRLTPPPPNCP